jgi:hypothetical protein
MGFMGQISNQGPALQSRGATGHTGTHGSLCHQVGTVASRHSGPHLYSGL